MKYFYVYILQCADQSYYVGMTSDIEKRINQHLSGYFPNSYTSKRLPVKLMYHERFQSALEAIDKEKQIKKWSKDKKEALISGNWEALVKSSKKSFK